MSLTLRRATWAALAFCLAGCHSAPPPVPYPTGYSRSPYRQPAESAAVSPADQEAIYHIVLEFYRPTHEQVRWIDQEFLPAAPGDSIGPVDPLSPLAMPNDTVVLPLSSLRAALSAIV